MKTQWSRRLLNRLAANLYLSGLIVGLEKIDLAAGFRLLPHRRYLRLSFSTMGEDRFIVRHLKAMNKMKLSDYRFVEIGAYHPLQNSVTALLRAYGMKGTHVEPGPSAPKLFRRSIRQGNRLMNLAITDSETDFLTMVLPPGPLSARQGSQVMTVKTEKHHSDIPQIRVPAMRASELQKTVGHEVNVLIVDAEGHDEKILMDWNFDASKPEVIMAEIKGVTLEELLDHRLAKKLLGMGYQLGLFNLLNAIFILERPCYD